jgi:dTDP-4-dehydrorhamnose reductase
VNAVKHLARASQISDSKLIHISTDYVFSGNSNEPWETDSERNPKSIYGKTKAMGEDVLIEEFAEISRIYRTSWLYSRFGKNFAKSIIRSTFKDEGDISVVNDQIGQPTSAIELSEKIVESIEADVPMGIYHATNAGSTTWFDFAREIVFLVGGNPERVKPISAAMLNRRASRPNYSVLSRKCWDNTSIDPMGHWQSALEMELPLIISYMNKEENE